MHVSTRGQARPASNLTCVLWIVSAYAGTTHSCNIIGSPRTARFSCRPPISMWSMSGSISDLDNEVSWCREERHRWGRQQKGGKRIGRSTEILPPAPTPRVLTLFRPPCRTAPAGPGNTQATPFSSIRSRPGATAAGAPEYHSQTAREHVSLHFE